MKKEQLIDFLKKQLEKLEDEEFDLRIWKDSTLRVLEKMLGPHHVFTEQCDDLDYQYTMSVEELYPKRIIDVKATIHRLKTHAEEWLDQLAFFDESEFEHSKDGLGFLTLTENLKILKNNLSGKTLQNFQRIAMLDDRDQALEEMTKAVADIEINTVQEILAEMLLSGELWKLKDQH